MKGKDALWLLLKTSTLLVIYELTRMTPAKVIKKAKLKEIRKELEFLRGDPKAKVNYKIVGTIDSKKED